LHVAPARTSATSSWPLKRGQRSSAHVREQLERHPERGGLRAGALGHARAQLDGGDARLDRIRGSQMPPCSARNAQNAVSWRRSRSSLSIALGYLAGELRTEGLAGAARRVRSALPSSDAAASWPAAAGAWGGRRGRWSCAPTALLARRDDVAQVCRLPVDGADARRVGLDELARDGARRMIAAALRGGRRRVIWS
jgi:hypothetical protein